MQGPGSRKHGIIATPLSEALHSGVAHIASTPPHSVGGGGGCTILCGPFNFQCH